MITIAAVLLCILLFFVGFGVIWLFCKLLKVSIKIIGKLFISSLLGALLLIVVNVVGGIFGLFVALTPINMLVAGAFGIPGVIILLLLA